LIFHFPHRSLSVFPAHAHIYLFECGFSDDVLLLLLPAADDVATGVLVIYAKHCQVT